MSRLVQLTCLASRGLAQPLLPQPNIATLRSLRVSGTRCVQCQLAASIHRHSLLLLTTHHLGPSHDRTGSSSSSSPHTTCLKRGCRNACLKQPNASDAPHCVYVCASVCPAPRQA